MKKGKFMGRICRMTLVVAMIASTLGGMFAETVYASDSDIHDSHDSAASETNNLEPCVPCGQSNLNLSENSTDSDWSTKPVIVNIQVDLEKEGDQEYVYDILDQIELRNGRTTVFVTGEFAATHPDIIRSIESRGHQIAVHGWQKGEDLTLLSYADQHSLISRAFAAVKGPVSKPEEVVDFKPQGYKFNDDTIRAAQESGAKSVSGIFTCQEPFCKCPYAQKLGKITFPYPVTNNFWLVPISEVRIDSEDTPLDDEYIDNPQEFFDYLIGKYTEQLQTKDPLIIAVHPSVTGADAAKLNAFSQFVDYATNNNGRIKPLSSLTHLTTYIPSLQITSAPQSASPGETVTITVQFSAAIYCPSYYFRIYGKYSSEGSWVLRAEHYHGVQTGTFSFSRSFTVPEPPASDGSYTVRVVGQGCSGTCWPTPYSYERMDEVTIELIGIKIIEEESDKCVDPRSTDAEEKEATIKYEIEPYDFSGKMYMEIKDSEGTLFQPWKEPQSVNGGKGTTKWDGRKPDGESVDQSKNPYYITLVLQKDGKEIRSNEHEVWVGRPVILVHGFQLFREDPNEYWTTMKEDLTNSGFKVYVSRYAEPYNFWSGPTNKDIKIYAGELGKEIEQIRETTGAKKVDIVAHSMGGLISRYYIQNCDKSDVEKLIILGTPNRGTELLYARYVVTAVVLYYQFQGVPIPPGFGEAAVYALIGEAGEQMMPGNPFLRETLTYFGRPNYYTIAGTGGWRSWYLPLWVVLGDGLRPNDGAVAVTSVKLDSVPEENHEEYSLDHSALITQVLAINKVVAILKGEESLESKEVISLQQSQEGAMSAQEAPIISAKINPGEQKSHEILITSTDEFSIMLSWLKGDLDLTLVTPSGVLIDPAFAAVDPSVDYYGDENLTIEGYVIKNPESGTWNANVTAANISAEENYTIMSFLSTNITLSVSLPKHQYDPNEQINISTNITYAGEAITNASVTAKIERPDDTTENITLYDDGLHSDDQANDGIYANAYADTSLWGIYDITVTANGMANGEEFKREAFATVWVEQYPDLTLSSSDISFSNDTPSAGDNVTIFATVHNIGDVNAANVSVFFYAGDPSVAGKLIGEDVMQTITVGGTGNVSASWTAQYGTHDIYVVISPFSSFLEKDYTNNKAHQTINVAGIPLASFNDVYSNYGVDTNEDGLYNYLRAEVGVNPTTAGYYTATGWLYDGEGNYIAFTSNYTYLDVGERTMNLDFDGMAIYKHGISGQFNLSYLMLQNGNGELVDYREHAYDTSSYNYTDFQRGGQISGFVTDTSGTPVYNAYVSANGPSFGSATTDVNGNYVISDLLSGIYNVAVSTPPEYNLFDGSATVTVVIDETTSANFALAYGGAITGTVTDNSGNPASDVYIYAVGPTTTSTVTGIDGSYNITGLESGSYTIRVEPLSPNLMLTSTSIFLNAEQIMIRDFALQVVGSIAGNITNADGIPIPNVSLYLSGYETARYRTDDSGHYAIPRLQVGTYTVNVDASETIFTDASAAVSVVLGETTTLDFILPIFAGGQIAGIVTDANGNGVYNARVSVSGPSWSSGYTDATGYYFISRLLAGNYAVTAEPPYGLNLVPSSTTAAVIQGETTIVDFILQAGGMITGRLTDEADVGISWAYIYAEGPGYRSTYTDEEGYYSIAGLQSGTYTVTAYPPYGVNLVPSSTTAEVIQGETTIVDLVLQTGGIIAGRVTDEADVGVPDAYIYADGPGYGYGYTDEEGYYTIFGLPSGTYTVTAEPPYEVNLLPSSTTAEVTQGETTTVDFMLQPGGIISGRVTDEDGAGLSWAYIYADGPGYRSTYTDEEGYYSIVGLQGGIYTVTAEPPYGVDLFPGSTSAEVVQGETTTVDFVLETGGTISGHVYESDGTTPIEGAWVDANLVHGGYGRGTTTASDGSYTITRLVTGQYRVRAYAEGYISEYYDGVYEYSEATAVPVTMPEDTPNIDFALDLGGTISGHVYQSDGTTPVEGVWVNANLVDGGYGRGATTNPDGSYTITGLVTGQYGVEAQPPYGVNLIPSSTTAEVIQGETTAVDFVLQAGGIIAGRVTNEAGEGVSGAYVCAYDPGYEYAYTDEEGYYSIAGLQAGTHTVYMEASGYGSWYIFVNGDYAAYDTSVSVGVTPGQTEFVDYSQQPPNHLPVANAGPDQTVCTIPPATTAMVTLDGSGSYDPDADPLTYTWTWDGNTAYGINPIIELPLGITTITLVVNDGKVDSEPDTVDITVWMRATIDLDPDTLNLKSKEKLVTAYIELPLGYNVSQINISSIRLNDKVPALTKPTTVGDYDSDGVPDLMVKFNRDAVQDALTVGEEIEVTITGEVTGFGFEGSDTINLRFAAAPPGLSEWTRVTTPTMDGWVLAPETEIMDYAVADGGDVTYAIVDGWNEEEDTYGTWLLKSEDGAATWTDITDALEDVDEGNIIGQLLLVATDGVDADFVAVALTEGAGLQVYISNDGGATFEDTGVVGVFTPYELEVSPEVEGDRDLAIAGNGMMGAALWRSTVTGDSAGAWEDATLYGAPTPDWEACAAVVDIKFAPSWAADKTVLVATVTDGAPDVVYLQFGTWGTSEGWNLDSILAIDPVAVAGPLTVPPAIAVPWSSLGALTAGITLPLDYSGRNSDKRYAWVNVNYNEATGPVGKIFRVKNKSVMEVNQQIEDMPYLTNVHYVGYIAEGKAIAGLLGDGLGGYTECCEGVHVYRNDSIRNMDICCVPWEQACKPPTGTYAMEAFYVSADKAYAVALLEDDSYEEGAWSVSFDDGDVWNQLSLVDTDIHYFSDVAVSPDCNKTWVVSVNDNTETSDGCDSVWLYADEFPEEGYSEYSGHWLRVWCGSLEGLDDDGYEHGILRLNPEETTGDTVYLADVGSDNVYWNELEGLACWDFGSASVDAIADLALLDKETIYALDYDGSVAMSDDFAIGWHEAVDSEVEEGWTIAVWDEFVLVGGQDGDVSYSDDGGETFTLLEEIPTIEGYVTVAFDSYFDTNDVVYAATDEDDNTGGIYLWLIGESDGWKNLGAANYAYTGLVLNIPSDGKPDTSPDTGGVLYASYVGGDTTGVARCLTPAENVRRGKTKWDYLTKGLTSELFKMTPQALKICGCLTANVSTRLFAIDSNAYYDMDEGRTGTVYSLVN